MPSYFYHVKFVPTGQYYVGCRYTSKLTYKNIHTDLWEKYFTSSKLIKALIRTHGKDAFETKVRKIFDSSDEAKAYETKFLLKVNAETNPKFLNQCNKVYASVPQMMWITNGVVDTMIVKHKPIPVGYKKGRSQSTRVKNFGPIHPLKGRLHVFDSIAQEYRMIEPHKFDVSRHTRSHNDHNKNRIWINNPSTGEAKIIPKTDVIPEGWLRGNPGRQKCIWYYHKETNQTIQLHDGDPVPDGFIKGRNQKYRWYTNKSTGTNLRCIPGNEPIGYVIGRTL